MGAGIGRAAAQPVRHMENSPSCQVLFSHGNQHLHAADMPAAAAAASKHTGWLLCHLLLLGFGLHPLYNAVLNKRALTIKWLIERGPASAAVVLGLAGKQWRAAASTHKLSAALFIVQRAAPQQQQSRTSANNDG